MEPGKDNERRLKKKMKKKKKKKERKFPWIDDELYRLLCSERAHVLHVEREEMCRRCCPDR